VAHLENEAEERREEVRSKGRLKHSEMNDL